MYTQSFEDAGRDTSIPTTEESPQPAATWRQLPPQANSPTATSETQPIYQESLEAVLEDSERHLDALWNMLNSQMNRLSNGYAPTTEAQATSIPSFTQQTSRTETTEHPFTEEIASASQNLTAPLEVDTPVAQVEAMETIPVSMPFNFIPTSIPSLVLPEEYEADEVVVQETDAQVEEAKSISDKDVEAEPAALVPNSTDTTEAAETMESDYAAEYVTENPIPMTTVYHNNTELPVSLTDASWLTVEPEPSSVSPMIQSCLPVLEETFLNDEAALSDETPVTDVVPQEVSPVVAGILPAVRIDSIFRDNCMVVTAREAGGITVLPTVTMRMQTQQNQSLQMRSTAMGEMPTGETPLVIIESREEGSDDPSAMRVEIAYSPDAPDVVFEVSSHVEDELQISMADTGSDLCVTWEVSKQKDNSARTKAIISRQFGEPKVVVEIQRFRDASDASVWCSLLSFSVLGH